MGRDERIVEELSGYQKIWHNRNARLWMNAAVFFATSLAVIYLTHSNRVRLDVKPHTRIEVSSKAESKGGLSINGMYVPYNTSNDRILMLTLEDFLDKTTGAYNFHFTKTIDHPAEGLSFNFKRGYVPQQLDFSTSVNGETRELTISKGMQLEGLIITYTDKTQYRVTFR